MRLRFSHVIRYSVAVTCIFVLSLCEIYPLTSLDIKGLVANDEVVDFIFSRTTPTTFDSTSFVYDSEAHEYNHAVHHDVEAVLLEMPVQNSNGRTYTVSADFYDNNGVIAETTFSETAGVYGSVSIPLLVAEGANGRDSNGKPNGDDNNNVITITATDRSTYTIRFRRRVSCLAESVSSITPSTSVSISANSLFSASITPVTEPAITINGDTILTTEELVWSVITGTGTAYFDGNTLIPLSNGTIKVQAKTTDGSNKSVISDDFYEITGQSGWAPHLGKIELRNVKGTNERLNLGPQFTSNPLDAGEYSTSVSGDYSAVFLSTMAPPDCQLYLNDFRISNNSELTLRLQQKTDDNPTNDFTLKVVKGSQEKIYNLSIEREIKKRLAFGSGDQSNAPYLSAPNGTGFGFSSEKTEFTVQAWIRWTEEPSAEGIYRWATIATMDKEGASDRGQFWLQHNQTNTAFEFAFRTSTGDRRFVQSTTVPQRGVWYHVAGVFVDGRIRIYVNGVEEAYWTGSLMDGGLRPVISTSRLWVGRSPSTSARLFQGNVRDLRMWVGTARTPSQIEDDYNGITPSPSPDYAWLIDIEAPGNVPYQHGDINLSTNNIDNDDFISCCENNMKQGQTFSYRPAKIDLSSADSESVIFISTRDYVATEVKFSLLGFAGDGRFEIWNHVSNEWQIPATIGSGVDIIGDPDTGTGFWIPIRKGDNTITTGAGRYVDDGSDTSYDGSDDSEANRNKYNAIFTLSDIIVIQNGFTITGDLIGTSTYPTSAKYVVLGYDQTEGGNLVTATSTPVNSGLRNDRGTTSFSLKSDEPIRRIEVRTQEDVLITQMTNENGWDETNNELSPQTLPVELSSFTAIVTADMAVKLDWTAETETNMLGYNIYRSETNSLSDAIKANFVIIPAHNTSVALDYNYVDEDVEAGRLYYYWLQSNDLDLTNEFHGPISVLVEPQGEPGGILLPEIVTELVGAYPNPFNPSTAIRFSLDAPAKVSIEVYNILGQHIKTLVSDEQFTKGFHSLVWDGKDSNGRSSSSGIYFYRMQTDQGFRMTKRMAIIK